MSEAAYKGHLISAIKLGGFITSQAKRILKLFEKSFGILTEEQAEAVYAKFSV